jgi:drug/metabolite transporter (DMT)-like permease
MPSRHPERALLGAALAAAAGVAGYYSYSAVKRRWPAYRAQRRLLNQVGLLSLLLLSSFPRRGRVVARSLGALFLLASLGARAPRRHAQ